MARTVVEVGAAGRLDDVAVGVDRVAVAARHAVAEDFEVAFDFGRGQGVEGEGGGDGEAGCEGAGVDHVDGEMFGVGWRDELGGLEAIQDVGVEALVEQSHHQRLAVGIDITAVCKRVEKFAETSQGENPYPWGGPFKHSVAVSRVGRNNTIQMVLRVLKKRRRRKWRISLGAADLVKKL